MAQNFLTPLPRVTVSVAIEAVCLRRNPETQEVEVYMAQRSPDDTAYPNEWHCPGSVMRPRETIEDVLSRLSEKEFGAHLLSTGFVCNINPSPTAPEARGHFLCIVYLCVLAEAENLRGQWFPLNNLPEKTVESHRNRIIPAALRAFVAEHAV